LLLQRVELGQVVVDDVGSFGCSAR
jgi:hypothetical protein